MFIFLECPAVNVDSLRFRAIWVSNNSNKNVELLTNNYETKFILFGT
jgi:hypothetical protein